jgi:hypothetical protein
MRRQYVTVQEFKHYNQIPTTLEQSQPSSVRLIHFTTTIRPDNSAVLVQRPADVVDAIGDCAVVLTILAAQSMTTLEACIDRAYYEIKDRKGRMVDGVFIREE